MRLIYNAKIYTLDPSRPVVAALTIQDGRILAAGSLEEVQPTCAEKLEKIDMKGQTIWPGLVDAHIHLEWYAHNLDRIYCETATIAECLDRVRRKADQTPAGQWLLGYGWNQNTWVDGFGNASDLDKITSAHPVYLTDKSFHAGWANTLALQIAGITASTPDPDGGHIQRDARGQPTGILFENAVALVEKVVPPPSTIQAVNAIEKAQQSLMRMGITGVHDFDQRRCFSALQMLHQTDRLKLRVVKGIPVELIDDAIRLGLRTGFGDDLLRIGSLKLFADGALGPQTAAMFQPYEGTSDQFGTLLLDSEQIFEIGQEAIQNGLSLAVHAIGDRANHEVLMAFAELRRFEAQNHLTHLRHRIEHVQCLYPDDFDRLADLDVIASMQPYHVISDMFTADRQWGPRTRGAYAWNTLLAQKTRLIFGSDAPVEAPNPFWGLHAAITRQQADGRPGPTGWHSQERLQLHSALEAYTTGPAYACGMEHHLGRLAPGYFADLIVLEQDPFAVSPQQLFNMLPVATMIAGQWIWPLQ